MVASSAGDQASEEGFTRGDLQLQHRVSTLTVVSDRSHTGNDLADGFTRPVIIAPLRA